MVDSKLSKLQTNAVKAKEKFNSLANVAACRRTELTGLEIRDKIMDKSLKSLEEELNRTADELVRSKILYYKSNCNENYGKLIVLNKKA